MMGIPSIGNPPEKGHHIQGVKGVRQIWYRKAEAQTDVLHITVVRGDRSHGYQTLRRCNFVDRTVRSHSFGNVKSRECFEDRDGELG